VHSRHSILGETAQIYRVPKSGDVWQFRMYIASEQKHYRKSLKTRDLDTAKSRASELTLDLLAKQQNGVKLFGMSLGELVAEYIHFRQEDVEDGQLSSGRLVTIKSQLKHFLELKGSDTKVTELDSNSLKDWRVMRRKKNPEVQLVTIRNEQATLSAMAKFANENGMLHFDRFTFRPIRISQDDIGKRDSFTLEEYDSLVKFMRSYVSKKECPDDVKRFERLMIRDYVLASSNTMMRVGELRQLRWSDIEKIEDTQDGKGQFVSLVYINVRRETSKVRKNRKVVSRGGEYFNRLKGRKDVVENGDLIFSISGDKKLPDRHWSSHWGNLMDGIDITDWKKRKLTWYSLRHFAITCRIRAGVDVVSLSKIAGTSISHIENTYLKFDEEMAVSSALKNFTISDNGIIVSE